MKVSGRKYVLLVLYVDDILLVANDTDILVKVKNYCLAILIRRILGKHLMSWAYKT